MHKLKKFTSIRIIVEFCLLSLVFSLVSGCKTDSIGKSESLYSTSETQLGTTGVGSGGGADSFFNQTDTETFIPNEFHQTPAYDAFRRQECTSSAALAGMNARERGYHCLKQICRSTPNATFNETTQECDCPEGQTFRSENRQGHCLANHKMQGPDGLGYRIEFPNSGTTIARNAIQPFRMTQIVPGASEASIQARDRLARSSFTPRGHYLSSRKFFVGDLPRDQMDRYKLHLELLNEAFPVYSFDSKINFIRIRLDAGYYEPNASNLEAALGDSLALESMVPALRSDFSTLRLPQIGSEVDQPELRAAVVVVQHFFREMNQFQQIPFDPQDFSFVSMAGCSEFCRASQSIPTSDQMPFVAQYEKFYYLGSQVSQRIVVRDRVSKKMRAVVQLNPGGGISSVLRIIPPYASRGSDAEGATLRIQGKILSYDRYWNPIGSSASREINDVAATLNQLASQATDYVRRDLTLPLLGVCEAWPAAPLNGMVLGPHFSADARTFREGATLSEPRSPIFGWGRTSESFENYLSDGFYPGDGLHLSRPEAHGSQVLNAMRSTGRAVAFAPLGVYNTCFNPGDYPFWKGQLRDAGIKVINISLSLHQSAEVCQEEFGSIYLDQDRPFLYVTAAGNDGFLGTRMKCPQNILLNNQNGLVVGALASSSETQMANYGNFGARAVDIATRAPSGTHLDGTSFTAAIVSEYANQLAKEFPQLSVSDIRLAILLGAEIPDLQNPLPVRSGGILNEFYARRLAQLIQAKRRALSGGPTLWNQSSRIHFLQTAFLDRVSHEEVSRRIQILDRSGLLSEGGR